jgi:hypothetical protein
VFADGRFGAADGVRYRHQGQPLRITDGKPQRLADAPHRTMTTHGAVGDG